MMMEMFFTYGLGLMKDKLSDFYMECEICKMRYHFDLQEPNVEAFKVWVAHHKNKCGSININGSFYMRIDDILEMSK